LRCLQGTVERLSEPTGGAHSPLSPRHPAGQAPPGARPISSDERRTTGITRKGSPRLVASLSDGACSFPRTAAVSFPLCRVAFPSTEPAAIRACMDPLCGRHGRLARRMISQIDPVRGPEGAAFLVYLVISIGLGTVVDAVSRHFRHLLMSSVRGLAPTGALATPTAPQFTGASLTR